MGREHLVHGLTSVGVPGDIYSVDTASFAATLLGNVTGGTRSVSDIEAIF